MNAPLKMLVWKEWRSRVNTLLVCQSFILVGIAYAIAYETAHPFRAPVGLFFEVALFYGLLFPIFLAMRTALGETTERTLAFTKSLPVSAHIQSWVRLLGGVVTLVAPMLVGALAFTVLLAFGWLEQVPARVMSDTYVELPHRASLDNWSAVGLLWMVVAVCVSSMTTYYLILCLIGTWLRAESHVGYVAAVLTFFWVASVEIQRLSRTGYASWLPWIEAWFPQSLVFVGSYQRDEGSYQDLMFAPRLVVPLLLRVVVQFCLAVGFVIRYGRKGAILSAKATRSEWRPISIPWRNRGGSFGNPWMAMIWLTLRQSVPLCLPGLLLAVMIAPFTAPVNFPRTGLLSLVELLPQSMWFVAMGWSVVVGAGVFANEVDARAGEFWRTRPIPFAQFFAVKFAVGLLVVILVLDGFTIATNWNSTYWGHYGEASWPYIACFPLLHATMYSLAVAWTCYWRRPVVGAMAAVFTFLGIEILLGWSSRSRTFEPIGIYNQLASVGATRMATDSWSDYIRHGYPLVAGAMVLLILISLAASGLFLRRHDPVCNSQ